MRHKTWPVLPFGQRRGDNTNHRGQQEAAAGHHSEGIALYDQNHGIDTSTPMGQAFYCMSGIFAGIERNMIIERIHAGLKRAKAEGNTLGRPRVSAEVEARLAQSNEHVQGTNIHVQ
jgi:hypothetical protein